MSETFVGIQIGAISFVDEGVEEVLDILQEKAGVNALLISALSWSIGNAGRAAFGFPDHGGQEADNLRGGAFFAPDTRYYRQTFMKQFAAPDELYEGFDTLADVDTGGAPARHRRLHLLLRDIQLGHPLHLAAGLSAFSRSRSSRPDGDASLAAESGLQGTSGIPCSPIG